VIVSEINEKLGRFGYELKICLVIKRSNLIADLK